MNKPKIFALGAIIVGAALITFFFAGRRNHNLISFLKENPEIQLSSLQMSGNFDGMPRAVSIDEPETLRYVTGALKRTNDEPKFGCVYNATLTFSNGKKCRITLDIPRGGLVMSIGVEKGWLEDLDHYGVDLVEPVPKGLADALIQLTSVEYMQDTQSSTNRINP
ncbi:MAG: hypothetical protein HOP33_01910 [Verrucomicrobia bacterium]|nr:hypothetical protein [Verrucomicrobiota bacterium]